MSGDVSMRWSNHCGILIDALQQMRRMDTFTDCVIIAEGRKVRVHKVILAAFSPYFEIILKEHSNYSMLPIVVVTTGVSYESMKFLVDYMYGGHVKVPPEEVGSLLVAAKNLQIKGVGESLDSEHSRSLEHSHCAYSVGENAVRVPSNHCALPVPVPVSVPVSAPVSVSAPLPVPSTRLSSNGMLGVRNSQPPPVAASGPGPGTSHPPTAMSDDVVMEVEVRGGPRRQRQRRSTAKNPVTVPATVRSLTLAAIKASDSPDTARSTPPAAPQHDTLASAGASNSEGNPKSPSHVSSCSTAEIVPHTTPALESAGRPLRSRVPTPLAVEVETSSRSALEPSAAPVAGCSPLREVSLSSDRLRLRLSDTSGSSREASLSSTLSFNCFRERSSSSEGELRESPTDNLSFVPSVESVSQLLMKTGDISAEVTPCHRLGRARRGRSTARRGTPFRPSQGSSTTRVSSEQQPANINSPGTTHHEGQESRTVSTNLSEWTTFESAASTCKTVESPPKKRRSGLSCRRSMGLRNRQSQGQPACPPEKRLKGPCSALKGSANRAPSP